MWLERNPPMQLQMQGANSKNRTISQVKSHIVSIVTVQSVAPVHFRIVRCHQIKKKHHIWLLLSKVFTDLEKVLFLKWRCPAGKDFHWWRGECSADPAIGPIVECSARVSPGQEGIVLRIKRQTQGFWSQQKQAHIDYQAHLTERSFHPGWRQFLKLCFGCRSCMRHLIFIQR